MRALVVLLLVAVSQRAGAAPELYFLAVGNANYRHMTPAQRRDPKRQYREFGDVAGAGRSARRIAELLVGRGAHGGTLLLSDVDRFVTHDDVFRALDRLLMRATKSPHPFVVVYIAGHGLSEGIGWNHFSLPGDFTGPIDLGDLSALARRTVYAGDLADRLDAANVDYLMLLDSCYEGTVADVPTDVLSPTAVESMRASFAVLRAMNEFRQPNPVIYSTAPGTVVPTVADPTAPDSSLRIGPIARRVLLATRDGAPKSLGELFSALLDGKLDAETTPAVSRAELGGSAARPVLGAAGGPATAFDTIIGTGLPRAAHRR